MFSADCHDDGQSGRLRLSFGSRAPHSEGRGWSAFPLSENLREALYEWGPEGRNIPPEISSGVWIFYDRFAEESAFDRRSDARLLSRPAENYSLLMFDSDTGRLYYYEMDT